MSEQLMELSDALAKATERASESLVAVHTEARGSLTGAVWRPGVVVTSEHALRRDEEIQVTLADGRVLAAELAGRDAATDLAVLKCAAATRTVAELGEAGEVKPGSLALVVGRTRLSGAVAALGVVSLVAAERRTWTGAALSPYIRLDVELQPTAMGGAVVDAQGRVVGLATTRFARFGAVAIPRATVHAAVDALLTKGRIPRGYLGVGLQPVRLPESLRKTLERQEKTAAMVLEVEPNGPAYQAGLLIGDILVSIGGRQITHFEDVQAQLSGEAIGRAVAVKYIRGGVVGEGSVVVGERPHGGA
jgi:S1-C subfamily serine protease